LSLEGLSWDQVWTYRRALAVGVEQSEDSITYPTVNRGEQSNQNLGNDYITRYLFSNEKKKDNYAVGEWAGGIDLKSLKGAEDRAYAWYHYMRETSKGEVNPFLGLNYTQVNDLIEIHLLI
jgi:hypothetical protein